MSNLAIRLGRRICTLRRAKNFTQTDLAEKSDLTPKSISSIERGFRKPSLSALERIAFALDVTIDKLLPPSKVDADKDSIFQEIFFVLKDRSIEDYNSILKLTKVFLRID